MIRFFTLLFAAVSLISRAQIPDYVPTDGLVDWWPLDGNAINLAGSNDGEIEGCLPAENRFGEASKALLFDDQDDRVSLDTFFGGQQMSAVSYSLWFNSAGSPGQQFLSGKEGYWRTIYIRLTSLNDIRFGGTSQGVYFGLTSNEQAFELNTWHHLVVTFEEATITLFLDGNQIAQGPSSANLLDYQFYAAGNSTATNYFGAVHPVSSGLVHFFNGKMDDFGLWNRALTEEEILALYNSEPPVLGCTDSTACNFNVEATIDEGCIPSGCMDLEACNYNALAECEGEACDYNCCPGPGCCGEGMHWDWELEQCQNTLPGDTNGDGCVQLNDLLDVLSAYGNCGQALSCGDPVSYQGYDYATVLIGEQCWFAENLRNENYDNGDAIPAGLSDSDWSSTTAGATAVYGEGSSTCFTHTPDGDACDEAWSLNEYGRLYNWYAVDDSRGLCPSGWHVPTDGEWMVMETALGMSESEANSSGWRGTDQGTQMKTTYGWNGGGNGTNSSGYSGLPGGRRYYYNGVFYDAGNYGYWWSSSPYGSVAWYRGLEDGYEDVGRNYDNRRYGFSVRCVRDAE